MGSSWDLRGLLHVYGVLLVLLVLPNTESDPSQSIMCSCCFILIFMESKLDSLKYLHNIKLCSERVNVHLMWPRQFFSFLQQTPATQTLSYNKTQTALICVTARLCGMCLSPGLRWGLSHTWRDHFRGKHGEQLYKSHTDTIVNRTNYRVCHPSQHIQTGEYEQCEVKCFHHFITRVYGPLSCPER